jgi:hypothetical protein
VSTKLISLLRALTDAMTFAEVVARVQVLTARTAADHITFSEAITSGKAVARTSADSLTFADVGTRGIVGQPRSIVDAVTFTDAVTRGIQVFARTSTDSLTFNEALTRAFGRTVTATDAVHFADVATRNRGFNRFPTDSLHFTEAPTRIQVLVPRTAIDLLTLIEAIDSIGPPTIRGSVEATSGEHHGIEVVGGGFGGSVEGW